MHSGEAVQSGSFVAHETWRTRQEQFGGSFQKLIWSFRKLCGDFRSKLLGF